MGKEKIILGIDPGTLHLGYGVLKINSNKIEVVCLGTLHLHKLENHALKLKTIFEKITHLIEEYLPDECALESPFFGKNVQSMLKLGRAQGVSMAAALNKGLSIEEYSPKSVKQSITGNGNANKEQVAKMLETICKIEIHNQQLDATDALAVALCHHLKNGQGFMNSQTKKNNWEAFIAQNKNRIVN